jgi:hypothetical protein
MRGFVNKVVGCGFGFRSLITTKYRKSFLLLPSPLPNWYLKHLHTEEGDSIHLNRIT